MTHCAIHKPTTRTTNTPFYKKRTNSIQQVIKTALAGKLDSTVARHRHVVCAELRQLENLRIHSQHRSQMVAHELEEASRRTDRLEPLQVRRGNAHLELTEASDHWREREGKEEPVPFTLLRLGRKTRKGRLTKMLKLESVSLGTDRNNTVKWDDGRC